MRHHSIVCRLGAGDKTKISPSRPDSQVTSVSFVDGNQRLGIGLGQVLDVLRGWGMAPSEIAVDFALFAATLTAADTRVSRASESQDGWTREIDLCVPVSDPDRWNAARDHIVTMLNFLTGDRWGVQFRPRPKPMKTLALGPNKLRTVKPSEVCLFSGGLDSFIGAIDLLAAKQTPMLVSHYWDGITSKHQTYCGGVLEKHFKGRAIHHLRARVGFGSELVKKVGSENTLRGRSLMFFALASMAGDAIGGAVTIYVPENGLISLNVPLDPLRLGALSTRTTHPFYMRYVQQLLTHLGLNLTLHNPYAFQSKGQMAKGCADVAFLNKEAKNTMSCSSPAKARWAKDPTQREPKHCGYCVPCVIRRAALVEAFGTDDTEYQIPDLAAQVLNTSKAEGEHVRSFQLALSHLAKHPLRARVDIHRPGPLSGNVGAYEKVYVEGMEEVGRFLDGVRAKPQ
jgi:hypothetical protein